MLCEHEWVIGTFDVCVERTSRHLWPSVLDGDEIVPGWQWCVAELIAFIDLSTDQLDPWRTADVDCQGTAAGLGRVDDELTQLTYNRPQHALTDRQIDRQLVPWDLVCIDVSQHCQSSVNQSNRDVVKWATSKTESLTQCLAVYWQIGGTWQADRQLVALHCTCGGACHTAESFIKSVAERSDLAGVSV